MQNGDGDRVRDAAARTHAIAAGARLDLVWDGFSDNGIAVAGRRVHAGRQAALASDDRAAEPDAASTPSRRRSRSAIRSTRSSRPTATVTPTRSPFDTTSSEPAHAILLVRGTQVVFTHGQQADRRARLEREARNAGRAPGRYVSRSQRRTARATSPRAVPFAIAQVRYVVLARDRVVVKPGGRFAMRVSTDAPSVQWRLNGRSGVLPRGTLHFRAPKSSGVYRLYVFAGGHAAKCAVVVA